MQMGGIGDVIGTAEKAKSAAETTQKVVKSFEEIPPEDEHYLGRAVAATIAGKYELYTDQQANAYINELGQLLAQASDRPETYGGYHFQILDSDEINAFAAPGGLIFVTRGILRCAQHEDAVAAVLAHEIGHVQHKHGLKAIKKSRLTAVGTEVGLDVAGALTDNMLIQLAGVMEDAVSDVTVTLVTDGYSRKTEYEADKAAVTTLKRVGYDPNGLVEMLKVMEEQLDPDGKDFAKTHPSPAKRIDKVQKIIGEYAEVKTSEKRQARFKKALGNI
jgi:predicted Zn-dependent protease